MSRVEKQLRKRWSRLTGRALSSLEEKLLFFATPVKMRNDASNRAQYRIG